MRETPRCKIKGITVLFHVGTGETSLLCAMPLAYARFTLCQRLA